MRYVVFTAVFTITALFAANDLDAKCGSVGSRQGLFARLRDNRATRIDARSEARYSRRAPRQTAEPRLYVPIPQPLPAGPILPAPKAVVPVVPQKTSADPFTWGTPTVTYYTPHQTRNPGAGCYTVNGVRYCPIAR